MASATHAAMLRSIPSRWTGRLGVNLLLKLSLRCMVASALALVGSGAVATEPLIDQLWIGDQRGVLFYRDGNQIALPANDKLRALRRQADCSAHGGPVGSYQLEQGKLWLVALHHCSDQLPVTEIYPDRKPPVLATWVKGDLVGRMGTMLCRRPDWSAVFERTVELQVKDGKIIAMHTRKHRLSDCAASKP